MIFPKCRKGFTLLEALIVIGILGAIFALTALFSTSARLEAQELVRGRDLIRDELVVAQANTISGLAGTAWGVAFFEHSLTRFQGEDYASRDPDFDINLLVSNGITISGTPEIDFTAPEGKPEEPGVITVSNSNNSYTITINEQGAISIH